MVLGAPLGTEVALDLVRNKGLRLRAAVGGGPEAGDSDYERLGVGYPRHLARWTTRENMACFCNLLSERRVQISPLVTDRTPIERAGLAYEKALRGRESVLGCVLTV
jgi:threonine dehydrogenase-like Zn-dependent dehydrogenase